MEYPGEITLYLPKFQIHTTRKMCSRIQKDMPLYFKYIHVFFHMVSQDSTPRQDPRFYSPHQNSIQYHVARKPIVECGEGLNLLPNFLLITLFIMTHTFLSSISIIFLCVCKSRMTALLIFRLYCKIYREKCFVTHTYSYFNKWLEMNTCVTLSLNTFLTFMLITSFFEIVVSPMYF